jgi:hypothetical protein
MRHNKIAHIRPGRVAAHTSPDRLLRSVRLPRAADAAARPQRS